MSSHVIRDRIWSIYVLIDPRDGAIRYVGMTTVGAKKVLANERAVYPDHWLAWVGGSTPRGKWIVSILKSKRRPILLVVEDGIRTRDGARAREASWTRSLLREGFLILNHEQHWPKYLTRSAR